MKTFIAHQVIQFTQTEYLDHEELNEIELGSYVPFAMNFAYKNFLETKSDLMEQLIYKNFLSHDGSLNQAHLTLLTVQFNIPCIDAILITT